MVENRKSCPMCSLVFQAIERRYPHLLQPQYGNRFCGWADRDDSGTEGKLLAIHVADTSIDFNWIQEGDTEPSPGRARDLSNREQNAAALTQLLGGWLRTCKDNHEQCRHVWSQRTLTELKLRFIDVKRWCIVPADQVSPSDQRYAALSYVWGPPPWVTMVSSNLSRYCQDGALRDIGLPATIQSAILLVEAMGVPYLWVDALCIIQDGDGGADKTQQIPNMDSVYGFAEFTVVQATGNDSSSPLLGFFNGEDNSTAPPEQLQGEVKPGLRLALQASGFDSGEKANSTWVSRAWTFQEAVLSPRMLLWHNGSVTWECREAVWCEDTVPGLATSAIKPQFGSQMLPFLAAELTEEQRTLENLLFIEPTGKHDNMSRYDSAVQEYTSRVMSFWTDKLNAFAGLGTVFERQMNVELLYGLPRDQLDTALLWASASGPLERLPDFPSWSWAGWKGAVRYHSQNTLSLVPLAAFYGVDDQTTTLSDTGKGSTQLRRLVQAWEADDYTAPSRPWRIMGNARQFAPHAQQPLTQLVPSTINLSRCLCFKAYSASATAFSFQGHNLILKDSGRVVGGVFLDQAVLAQDTEQLEMVVLSQCSASIFGVSKGKNPQVEYFPDGMFPEPNMPDIRVIEGRSGVKAPLDCYRFLVAEKQDDGTVCRKGMGETKLSTLNEVGVRRKWVFLA